MARQIHFKTLSDELLLKNARIIDLKAKKDERGDVLIKNGKIEKTGVIAPGTAQVLDLQGAILTHGFMDMHVHLREPGREDKETIWTGCNAAMAGGFTALASMPNTTPAADTPDTVQYIQFKSAPHLVEVFPVGCVTKNREGKELAEIAALVKAGIVAVSDDGEPVYNAEIMRRALEYLTMYRIPLIQHAEDKALTNKGSMHEGFMSTRLGMKPIPRLSEEVVIARDILIAEYTGAPVHFAHVSTAGSVRMIREAKARGVPVTCEATPHHFTLTDEAVESFNPNTKMNPPLREAADVQAIREGLRDGTIDAIASDHAPHTVDDKDCEYDLAAFGIIGLETSVGLALTNLVHTGVLTIHQLIERMALAPRKILNLKLPEIKAGEEPCLTVIDPERTWTYDVNETCSVSQNTPFHGYAFRGKAAGVIHKNKMFFE